jgi:hypothetical protein
MKCFTHDDVPLIKHLAERGHEGTAIARKLGRTALAIRHKCCELGIRLRPERAKTRLRILLERPFYDALIKQARTRNTTAPKLARLLLVTLLIDDLLGAVLDMPVGKGEPVAKSRRAAPPARRAPRVPKSVPAPQPSMALLLSPRLQARFG